MTVEFPGGLPGFEDRKWFSVVERADAAPIVLLETVDAPALRFLAAPLSAIDPAYDLAIAAEDLSQIGGTAEPMLCLAILSATENGPWTANLLAPVVINPQT